ncbi:MAG: FAD-binding oxidoreductase [Bacteroidota bacterium]
MKQRFTIIGGGLAGSFMAARLCQAGQEVTLIDDQEPQSASRVAAGLFNVITGRYGAKSWMADQLLEDIQAFFDIPVFQSLSKHVHYTPIYRAFKEEAEYNKWLGRSAEPAFRELVELVEQPLLPKQIINPHGGIMILPCGWLDIPALLRELHDILIDRWGLHIIHESVPFDHISLTNRNLWMNEAGLQSFDHLILCQGHHLTHCPWLPAGSIIPNKGEILILESDSLDLPFVLSKKIYMIPIGEGKFLSGSTYANQFEHAEPTFPAADEIMMYVDQAIHVPVRVLDHWAGIRPTTRNRRPIIGTHPVHPCLHVLGGFGTKGVLLAPFSSRLLTDVLLTGEDQIPEEARVERLF